MAPLDIAIMFRQNSDAGISFLADVKNTASKYRRFPSERTHLHVFHSPQKQVIFTGTLLCVITQLLKKHSHGVGAFIKSFKLELFHLNHYLHEYVLVGSNCRGKKEAH